MELDYKEILWAISVLMIIVGYGKIYIHQFKKTNYFVFHLKSYIILYIK